MQPRQHPQHLRTSAIDANIGTERVHDIDRLCLLQLPRPRHEGIGFRRQRSDRAEINHIAREFRGERLLEIGSDLHRFSAPERSEIVDACHFRREPNTAGTMDAAGHDGLDERPHELLVDAALVFVEPAGMTAIAHRLVLQIAFPALVADRAVERMIDEQEFHDAVPRLANHFAVGDDLLVVHRRQGATRLRFRRPRLHLDQTHAAIAGDRQPLVIAESRNLAPGSLAGL